MQNIFKQTMPQKMYHTLGFHPQTEKLEHKLNFYSGTRLLMAPLCHRLLIILKFLELFCCYTKDKNVHSSDIFNLYQLHVSLSKSNWDMHM